MLALCSFHEHTVLDEYARSINNTFRNRHRYQDRTYIFKSLRAWIAELRRVRAKFEGKRAGYVI